MKTGIENAKATLKIYEDYLLKLNSGNYTVAYWSQGQFYSGFGDMYIEEEIVDIVALKDLGL